MVLSTQVADKDRQSASLYPFPLTPLLGLLHLASGAIVAGILADFVYELQGEKMSVPPELIVPLGAACLTVFEQLISFVRQRFTIFPSRSNLYLHLLILVYWIAAFALLSYRLKGMVLSHTCTLALWQSEMGLMVCRMYKAAYAFSAVCVITSMALAALDWMVLKETKSAGAYRALADPSPYIGARKTPDMGPEKSPILKDQ